MKENEIKDNIKKIELQDTDSDSDDQERVDEKKELELFVKLHIANHRPG